MPPDLDAEARKLGPDFKARQAKLNEALYAKASSAEGFRDLEQLLGTQPKPAPVRKMDFVQRRLIQMAQSGVLK